MSELTNCLDEILTDENGNKITPACGQEKLLKLLVDNVQAIPKIVFSATDPTVIDDNTIVMVYE